MFNFKKYGGRTYVNWMLMVDCCPIALEAEFGPLVTKSNCLPDAFPVCDELAKVEKGFL